MAKKAKLQKIDNKPDEPIRLDFYNDWNKRRHLSYTVPFIEILEINEAFIKALYNEFAKLPATPKLDLYTADLMDLNALEAELKEHYSSPKRNSTQESKWNELSRKYHELIGTGKLPKKYYGRYLTHTPTVQILKKVKQSLTDFRQYIFENANIEQDAAYAKMMAGIITDDAAQISIRGLGKKLIEHILADDDSTLMLMHCRHLNEYQCEKALKRYRDLKRYFQIALKENVASWNNSDAISGIEEKLTNAMQLISDEEKIPADFLMIAVQLYSNMVNSAWQNRRQGGKVEYKAEGLLSEIFKQLQERNKEIDVHGLFHSLHYLLAWKTFDDISEGQAVVQELQALNIEVPALVQNCIKEIEMRSRLVKEYATEKHQWSEEKIQNWKDEIERKLLAYSYDNSSRKHHLAGLFSDAVSEIKKLESEAVAKYGYYIDGFYKAGTFVATENDLNNLFFHGETFAGGHTAFHNIFLLLIKYIDKHNEVALLKNLINNQKQFEKDKIPYTHREIMIAHEYKRKAKIEKYKTANDWKKERGNGCYNDFYTLQPKTKNIKYPYKEPTAKELGKVIELLEGYPQLQEQVRRKLESL